MSVPSWKEAVLRRLSQLEVRLLDAHYNSSKLSLETLEHVVMQMALDPRHNAQAWDLCNESEYVNTINIVQYIKSLEHKFPSNMLQEIARLVEAKFPKQQSPHGK